MERKAAIRPLGLLGCGPPSPDQLLPLNIFVMVFLMLLPLPWSPSSMRGEAVARPLRAVLGAVPALLRGLAPLLNMERSRDLIPVAGTCVPLGTQQEATHRRHHSVSGCVVILPCGMQVCCGLHGISRFGVWDSCAAAHQGEPATAAVATTCSTFDATHAHMECNGSQTAATVYA
jgi:hypothetical protein